MEFRLLGTLEVLDRERPLEVGSRRQRALLTLLALHPNRVVSAERILDALWGDQAAGKENAMWIAVSRLRSALRPDEESGSRPVVETRDHGYLLNVRSDQVDIGQFDAAIDQARKLVDDDPRAALEHIDAALALWRGAALEEFAFEDFAQAEIARLDERRLEAMELRALVHLQGGSGRGQVAALEALHEQHPLRERFVELLMRSLYQAGRQADALRLFGRHRRTIGDELGIEPSPKLKRLEEQILLHDAAICAPPHASQREDGTRSGNPFKGLRSFQEHDAGDFFGRDELVAELVDHLASGPTLVGVVGPSGSGKSSVVRAGLVPAIRRGALSGSDRWVIAQMVPGAHPFAEARAAIGRAVPASSAAMPDRLSVADELGLVRAALAVIPDEGSKLLLVIDQLEELFLLVDEELRRQFIANLMTAVDDPHGRIVVVATIRADLYDRPLQDPVLGSRLSGNVVNVTPLSSDELQAAAVRPASRAGVSVEPALLGELISEVGSAPGALPLFQYALTELFDRRSGGALGVATYRAMGGIDGALGRRADALFRCLDAEHRDAARQLFLRLVVVTEGGVPARRRVDAAELISLETDVVAMQAVIERFGAHRLLSFDQDPLTGAPTVEVAHEALATAWPQLAGWLRQGGEDLGRLASLRTHIQEWEAAANHVDYLLAGSQLLEFRRWQRRALVTLTSGESGYLAASQVRHEADAAAAAARQQKEIRRLRVTVLATAAALVVALAAGAVAFVERGRADDRARASQHAAALAEARNIASTSQGLQVQRPALALALAAESGADFDPPPIEATDALVQARAAFDSGSWARVDVDIAQPVAVSDLAMTSGGELLALVDGSPELGAGSDVHLVDAETGQLAVPLLEAGSPVLTAAFSPDDTVLATADVAGVIELWDPATGLSVGEPLDGHGASVSSLAFSPDGAQLASGSRDGLVLRWDVASAGSVGEPLLHEDAITALAYSGDGTVLAAAGGPLAATSAGTAPFGGREGFLQLWDAATGAPLGDSETSDLPLALVFSADGTLLASAGSSSLTTGSVRLWDAHTAAPRGQPLGNLAGARSVAFTPDSELVFAGGLVELRGWDVASRQVVDSLILGPEDGTSTWGITFADRQVLAAAAPEEVRLFTRSYGDTLGTDAPPSSAAIFDLAFAPDGSVLASGGRDGTARLWDPFTGTEIARPVTSRAPVGAIGFSADSALLAAGDFDGNLWLVATSGRVDATILARQPDAIRAVAFAPDGEAVVAAGANRVDFWDPATGGSLGSPLVIPSFSTSGLNTAESRQELITDLSFSHDGRYLAISSVSGRIVVHDRDAPEVLGESFVAHDGAAFAVGFSPDSALLATAGSDDTVRLWDLTSWQQVGPALVHPAAVEDLGFAPPGGLVITGDHDGSVQLWDPATSLPVGPPFAGHDAPARAVAASPDGLLASAAADGTLRIWDILDARRACELADPLVSANELTVALGPGRDATVCDLG